MDLEDLLSLVSERCSIPKVEGGARGVNISLRLGFNLML